MYMMKHDGKGQQVRAWFAVIYFVEDELDDDERETSENLPKPLTSEVELARPLRGQSCVIRAR